MEWLTANLMAPILATLTAWFLYDKRQRDVRMALMESSVKVIERRIETQEGEAKVLAERLAGMTMVVDAKLDSIQRALTRLEKKGG